ncbi:hypothetical protein BDN70DRAFT_901215, partial [Pholiota conissans]
MEIDSFPNSGQLFRSAFDLPNSASELLKLIKEHPTYPAIIELVVIYAIVAEKNPIRAEALASTMLQVRNAPDAPTVGDYTIAEIFYRELASLHRRALEVDDIEPLTPSNFFLTSSLLSALSF